MDEVKGSHLVSWEAVGRPVNQGGLEIVNFHVNQGGLEIVNLRLCDKAQLAKWLWHCGLEPESLCHRIIESKYDTHAFYWVAKGVKGTHRNPWKDILLKLPLFSLLVHCGGGW